MATQVILDLQGMEQDALRAATAMEVLTDRQLSAAKAAKTAAKEAKRSLAAFDTIEKLKSGASAGSGSAKKQKEETVLPEELPRQLTALEQLWQRLQQLWQQYGQPVFAGAAEALHGLSQLAQAVYTTVVQPILAALKNGLAELWQAHLLPLWESLKLCLSQLGETLLQCWNSVLLPLGLWIVETFGPAFAQLGVFLTGAFTAVAGAAADLARLAVQVFTGLLESAAVFAAAFGAAFTGMGAVVTEAFRGIWDFAVKAVNGIIGCVNGLIRGVTAAINLVVEALNRIHLDIPDWVPGYGGRTLGFHLDTLPAPQIPYLATGAVIPANSPFLAVLGDQKRGTNIETPLETMVEAFREAQAGQTVNIRFTGSLAQMIQLLNPVVEQENRRLGPSLLAA